ATRLPVAAAFHSALVADAQRPFRAALESIRVLAARLPVFANTSAGPYPDDPAAVRELLAGQLARPVDFVGEVGGMIRAGVRTFLEVGPRGVLTRLVESIRWEGRAEAAADVDAFALDSSAGKRPGVVDLALALARLAARGHAVRLSAWEEGNDPEPPRADKPALTVPICGANYVKPKPKRPAAPKPAPVPPQPDRPTAPTAPRTATVSERPPTPPLPPSALSQALQITQEGMATFQRLQEQTAQLHRQVLQGQEAAQQTP